MEKVGKEGGKESMAINKAHISKQYHSLGLGTTLQCAMPPFQGIQCTCTATITSHFLVDNSSESASGQLYTSQCS